MEELQSTEALDREILEDARKKAFKILKSADESAASAKAAWDRKLERTLKEVRENFRDREASERREITARLPMDRQRIRSEKIEGFLNGAMKDFLASLDRGKILGLLERELLGRLAVCHSGENCSIDKNDKNDDKNDENCSIRYRGLEDGELERILKKALKVSPLSKKTDPLFSIRGAFPALVLDFPDFRVTASVDAAAAQLLLDKRAELAGALLGENCEELTGAAGD
jgi:vacuolar-type H+-ATPase subunit H